jgi:prepilin-type N-terminal cleavage/methylation domain-containing protein
MLTLRILRSAAREESGFTLIELVVAMLISGVIVVVLLTVLKVTTEQTSVVTEKVQATRTGRQTMTKVLDELHSACIASGSTGYFPVQAGSTPNKLIFYNAYSKQAAIPSASENASEGVYKHEIVFNESKGTLIDTSIPTTSVSSWPEFKSFGTPAPHTLGENLSKTSSSPIFEYFRYKETGGAISSETNGLETLEPITPESKEELSGKQAPEVAAVLVRFTASPTSHIQKFNRAISLSSEVTFAFTSPSAESTINDSPCE